jgi:hypothetical protein
MGKRMGEDVLQWGYIGEKHHIDVEARGMGALVMTEPFPRMVGSWSQASLRPYHGKENV